MKDVTFPSMMYVLKKFSNESFFLFVIRATSVAFYYFIVKEVYIWEEEVRMLAEEKQ